MNKNIEVEKMDSVLEKSGDYLNQFNKKLLIEQLENRVINLDLDVSPIDSLIEPTTLMIAKQIISWNRADQDTPIEERKPIKLYIHSYGGDLPSTFVLINIMQLSKTPIYTYILGEADSAAFYIAIHGTKRYAMANSSCLIHEGGAQFQGNANEIRKAQEQYEKELTILKGMVYDRTKITPEQFSSKYQSDWYLNSKEMLEFGIIDAIVSDISQLF